MSLGDLQRLSQAAAAYKRLFNLTDDGRNLEKADAVREMHAVINAMSANDVLSWIDTINPNNPVVGAYMRLDLARYFLDEFEKTRHTITANIYEYEDEIDPDVAIVGDFFDDFLPKYRDAIDRMVQRERTSPSMEDEKVLQRFIKRIDTFKQSPEEMRKFIESNVRELNPMPRMRRLRHLKANCPDVTIRIRLSNIIDEYKKQDIAAEVAQMRRVAAQPLTWQADPTPEAQPSLSVQASAAAVAPLLDFSHMESYTPTIQFDMSALYRFLLDEGVIRDIDERLFSECITHGNIKLLWDTTPSRNYLKLSLQILKDFYKDKPHQTLRFNPTWYIRCCESIDQTPRDMGKMKIDKEKTQQFRSKMKKIISMP